MSTRQRLTVEKKEITGNILQRESMSSSLGMVATSTEPQLRWVDVELLRPNSWNPNAMDSFMFAKAVESLKTFGFVDPITCRSMNPGFEIIDGEHRWRAAQQEGITVVPIFDLGIVPEDVAIQLTIVLNETRGQVDPRKLGVLLKDLNRHVSKEKLLATLPYTKEAFDRLTGEQKLDFSSMSQIPRPSQPGKPTGWVERIYRMPTDSAKVLDEALSQIKQSEDGEIPDWQALELMAADFLGS